jgi:transcriptional regulator with XRE-family HTH domain
MIGTQKGAYSMAELLENIGHNVRRLREEKGWNQTELGFHADTSPSIISLIENGKRNPSTATLAKISAALGVEVVELFPKAARRSPNEPSFNDVLAEERRHEGLLRTYQAAAAFGRTVVESFKNFKTLDMQRLAAFQQLEHGLLMMRGKRDILGKEPEDFAEAIGELEEVSALVNERLNEHLDTSPPQKRQKFQQELSELTERIAV